ncbi:MAG: hypothetical protein IJ873_04405 [Lachnospiraceae bacterium]|nr:hypothetical protein [Lachnospiraceae bacterium]
MKKMEIYRNLLYSLIIALIYIIMDFPVQKTGYLHFAPVIGLKNFLPFVSGLFWGPAGALGAVLGAVLSGLALGNAPAFIMTEAVCNLIIAFGIWESYYSLSATKRVRVKTPKELIRFLGLLLFWSLLSAALGSLFKAVSVGELFFGYFSIGLLVGTPVCILFSSLLCVSVMLPFRYKPKTDVSFVLDKTGESLGAGNEAIEDYGMIKKIGMKRIFEAENCIEELYLRVIRALPDTKVNTEVIFSDTSVSDTISIRFMYMDGRYNPLAIGKDEDEIDLVSLKLLRHRALRASYLYDASRINHVHIVL